MTHYRKSFVARWWKLTLMEQLAHVGSEVSRALTWQSKNIDYSRKALWRALELLWLTIADPKNKKHLKELTRTYEFLVDYFLGENQYGFTQEFWQKYFLSFAIAARK